MNVAVLGTDSKSYLYSAVFGVSSDEVSALTCYGGQGFGKPAFVANSQRAMYFMVDNPSHNVLAREFLPDGTDSGWQNLSLPALSGIDAIQDGARTDIFYIANTAAREVMHSWQTTHGGAWATENMGGASDFRPSVTRAGDGKWHVWVTGANGSVYYNAGNTGAWGGWTKITTGATNAGPTAVIGFESTNTREDVFVSGTTGGLYQGTFTNLGSFTGWQRRLNVNATEVSAAVQGTGTVIVAMNTAEGDTVQTQWFPGIGAWADPAYLMPYLCDFCQPTPPALARSASSPTALAPVIDADSPHLPSTHPQPE